MTKSPTGSKGVSEEAIAFGSIDAADTAAATDGMPWERLLSDDEQPERVIVALAQQIQADLKSWTGATAKIFYDNASKTITLESRTPAPEGTVVFKASITLCIDDLTTESEGRRLTIVPRIVAGTLLWKDRVAWVAHGSEDQFADYLQQIQQRLGDLSL